MHSLNPTVFESKKMIWAGRIVSGSMIAFLVMDGVMHLTKIAPVVEAFNRLGFPLSLAIILGVVELACTVLYLYPRTSVLGAILLTGYLGGAVTTHLRVGSSLFGETLFPIYVGVLLWAGLYLRGVARAFWPAHPTSRKMLWAGRVVSALPALLLLAVAVPKLLMAAPMVEGFKQAGYPAHLVVPIGFIELMCTVVYLIPKTRIVGAILMTGLLGGAVATNVRIGDPTWIAPAILGVLVWGGLFLRDQYLRTLIPLRSVPDLGTSTASRGDQDAKNSPIPVV